MIRIMQWGTVGGMFNFDFSHWSLEKEMVLKQKHTKGKKSLIVKAQKRVSFPFILLLLSSQPPITSSTSLVGFQKKKLGNSSKKSRIRK